MKIEHITLALVAIIILFVISAYYSPETQEDKKEEPKYVVVEQEEQPAPQGPEQTKPAEPKEAVVKVKNGFFDPKEITVEKGTKVVWLNEDDGPHKIASTTRYFYGERFLPGESYGFTFDEAGEYNYFDVIFYKTMKGKVIVKESGNLITGKAIAVPPYSNRATGALVIITIVTLLSIHMMFYYERK